MILKTTTAAFLGMISVHSWSLDVTVRNSLS